MKVSGLGSFTRSTIGLPHEKDAALRRRLAPAACHRRRAQWAGRNGGHASPRRMLPPGRPMAALPQPLHFRALCRLGLALEDLRCQRGPSILVQAFDDCGKVPGGFLPQLPPVRRIAPEERLRGVAAEAGGVVRRGRGRVASRSVDAGILAHPLPACAQGRGAEGQGAVAAILRRTAAHRL